MHTKLLPYVYSTTVHNDEDYGNIIEPLIHQHSSTFISIHSVFPESEEPTLDPCRGLKGRSGHGLTFLPRLRRIHTHDLRRTTGRLLINERSRVR